MPATVIDASALAAVVFAEPSSDEVAARVDRAERVVAPALLWFELANTCWKKIHRHPDQRESDRLIAWCGHSMAVTGATGGRGNGDADLTPDSSDYGHSEGAPVPLDDHGPMA
jgi:uncharacterized protein with PIN domain